MKTMKSILAALVGLGLFLAVAAHADTVHVGQIGSSTETSGFSVYFEYVGTGTTYVSVTNGDGIEIYMEFDNGFWWGPWVDDQSTDTNHELHASNHEYYAEFYLTDLPDGDYYVSVSNVAANNIICYPW